MDSQDKIRVILNLGRICRECLKTRHASECRMLLPSQRCKDCGVKDPRRRNTTARNRRRRMQRENEATRAVAEGTVLKTK